MLRSKSTATSIPGRRLVKEVKQSLDERKLATRLAYDRPIGIPGTKDGSRYGTFVLMPTTRIMEVKVTGWESDAGMPDMELCVEMSDIINAGSLSLLELVTITRKRHSGGLFTQRPSKDARINIGRRQVYVFQSLPTLCILYI